MVTIISSNHIHDEVRERLARYGTVEMNSSLEPWSARELATRVANADAMMGFMTDCVDAALLQAAPRLRIVACALKGFDSYDVEACTRAGVWLSIVPDLLTEPTAELALGLAISLARHVVQGNHAIRTQPFKGWRAQFYGTGLQGSVAAVIGLGRVGRAIIERLRGFGCARILGVDEVQPQGDGQGQGVEAVSLDKAMALADYVFVAVPLTAHSLHLIGTEQLEIAKPGQLMINVGRGSVVNEDAVIDALYSGRLAGYAADVFACEDWRLADRPATIPPRLLAHPATLFTPHLGSAVSRVRIAIEHRAADNIIAVLEGRTPADAINNPVANRSA
jgi:phosphonate dehydrogenase